MNRIHSKLLESKRCMEWLKMYEYANVERQHRDLRRFWQLIRPMKEGISSLQSSCVLLQ